MLWYLENCENTVLELYRRLLQMKNAGWFKNANGILIGRTFSKESISDFTYEDALHKTFDDLNIPVIYDVDFGHVPPQLTLINGSFAKFEYESGKGKIKQELV
jgi:muramoyltetrapeptide carboxypeptidase LdcA involved in peptidoglycan recycling